MVLLNQRTYYGPSVISETISTLDAGDASGSENPTSVQLSTIRFNDSKTFTEARMHGASENELSNNDSEKDGQKTVKMKTAFPNNIV